MFLTIYLFLISITAAVMLKVMTKEQTAELRSLVTKVGNSKALKNTYLGLHYIIVMLSVILAFCSVVLLLSKGNSVEYSFSISAVFPLLALLLLYIANKF